MLVTLLPTRATSFADRFEAVLRLGSMYWRGYDRRGRPVLWVFPGRKDWARLDVRAEIQLHVFLVEIALRWFVLPPELAEVAAELLDPDTKGGGWAQHPFVGLLPLFRSLNHSGVLVLFFSHRDCLFLFVVTICLPAFLNSLRPTYKQVSSMGGSSPRLGEAISSTACQRMLRNIAPGHHTRHTLNSIANVVSTFSRHSLLAPFPPP